MVRGRCPGRWMRWLASTPRKSVWSVSRLPALQRKQSACRLLISSEPPLFLGMMWSTSSALWSSESAALAAASGSGEPRFYTETLAKLRCPNTSSPRWARKSSRRWWHSGDAVAGEHPAHYALHPFGVVVDLEYVFAQDSPGHVLRWGGAAAAQQIHEHQWLIDVWG